MVEEKVVVFIDNVMIVMEIEEGYNEIVKEVLRRLEKNVLQSMPPGCSMD